MTSGIQNVQQIERIISLVAGGAAIASGVYRGGPTGILKALAGAALLQRGSSGHCTVKGLITNPETELAYLRQCVADLRAALLKIDESVMSHKRSQEATADTDVQQTFTPGNPTSPQTRDL